MSYRVSVRGKTLTVVRRRMPRLFGITYPVSRGGKGKITIDSSLSGLPAISTLIHEMLHQMDWRLSEARVQQLEYAIVHTVLSNPALFRALAEQAPPPVRRRASRRPRRP